MEVALSIDGGKEKRDPPPLLDEDRSTKKVQIRETEILQNQDMGASMEVERVSFKDKLVYGSDHVSMEDDKRAEDDFQVLDCDVSVGFDTGVPAIQFSDRVQNYMAQNMKLTVVVKLLGRSIGYWALYRRILNLWQPKGTFLLTDLEHGYYMIRFESSDDYLKVLSDGPWVIFGHYLMVQPWSPSFSTSSTEVASVVAWIRFPNLPIQYYHKSVLRAIAKVIGAVVRIDYNTETLDRGKFARLAITLDLTKPLVSKLIIDGRVQLVEYEGLPMICFHCGRYGHVKETCPHLESVNEVTVQQEGADGAMANHVGSVPENSNFGQWMQVTRRGRRVARNGNFEGLNGKSRFDAIANSDDMGEDNSRNAIKESGVFGVNQIDFTVQAQTKNVGRKHGKARKSRENDVSQIMREHDVIEQGKQEGDNNKEKGAALRTGSKAGSGMAIQARITTLDPTKHTVVSVRENDATMEGEDRDTNFIPENFPKIGQSSGSKNPEPPDKTKAPWAVHLHKPSRNLLKFKNSDITKTSVDRSVMENTDSLVTHDGMLDLTSDSEAVEDMDDGIEPAVALED